MEKIVKVGTGTWFSKKSAAIADAKIRLLKEYPTATIIQTEPINDSMGYWAASATGAVVKESSFLKKLLIKDIYNTKLYNDISTAIEGNSVVKYKIVFKDFTKDQHEMVFTGTGNIEWKGIENYINEYNQNTLNRFKVGEEVEKFYVNIRAYGKNVFKTNTVIEGFILLKDGSWITLEPKECVPEEPTFITPIINSMSIHTLPKGDDIKAGFNVKLSLPGKPDVYTDTVSASNVNMINGDLKFNIDAASNAKQAYMALRPNVPAEDINVFSIGKSDGKERALAGKKVVQPVHDLKEEKDVPVETRTDGAIDDSWLFGEARDNFFEKAIEEAKPDAKKKLDAIINIISSYIHDDYNSVDKYVSDVERVLYGPANTEDNTPKEEPTKAVKVDADKMHFTADYARFYKDRSKEEIKEITKQAAERDARRSLLKIYPTATNIKVRTKFCTNSLYEGLVESKGWYCAEAIADVSIKDKKIVSVSKANFFCYGGVNSLYPTARHARDAARLDARNRLVEAYPGVRNVKVINEHGLFTSPGGYYQAWAVGEIG